MRPLSLSCKLTKLDALTLECSGRDVEEWEVKEVLRLFERVAEDEDIERKRSLVDVWVRVLVYTALALLGIALQLLAWVLDPSLGIVCALSTVALVLKCEMRVRTFKSLLVWQSIKRQVIKRVENRFPHLRLNVDVDLWSRKIQCLVSLKSTSVASSVIAIV